MPKTIRPWIGLVWKKCPVSNAHIHTRFLEESSQSKESIQGRILFKEMRHSVYFWKKIYISRTNLCKEKNNIPRYLILSNSGVVPLTIAACNTSKRRRRKEKTCSISGLFSLLLKVHSSSTQVLMSGIQSTFDTKK